MQPGLCTPAVAGLWLWMAAPALAQDAPDAVGRLSFGAETPRSGAAICTGTLVAPDLVLTADHCLRPALTDPASVYFQAGLVDGTARALRRGAEIFLSHPGPDGPTLADDLGLLRLDQPLPADLATPLALGEAGLGRLSVAAYSRAEPDIRGWRDDCFRVASMTGVIGLTCSVVSGNSGAPVLYWEGGVWRIAAVVVASGQGLIQAYAAVPPDNLIRLHLN